MPMLVPGATLHMVIRSSLICASQAGAALLPQD